MCSKDGIKERTEGRVSLENLKLKCLELEENNRLALDIINKLKRSLEKISKLNDMLSKSNIRLAEENKKLIELIDKLQSKS